MFKNDYKNEMDKILPSEESIGKTKDLMEAEISKADKRKIKYRLPAVIAACLCLAVIVGAVMIPFLTSIKDLVSGDESTEVSNGSGKKPTNKKLNGIAAISDYEELKGKIKNFGGDRYLGVLEGDRVDIAVDEVEDAPTGEPVIGTGEGFNKNPQEEPADTGNGKDHSETNNQVKGVQEGDIVKTDGRYIYFYSRANKKIYIVSAENGRNENVSCLEYMSSNDEGNFIPNEILLEGDRLIVISDHYTLTNDYVCDCYQCRTNEANNYAILIDIYDISDRAEPKRISRHEQKGYYKTARITGGKLYTVSTYFAFSNHAEVDDIEKLIPSFDGEKLECEEIYVTECENYCLFTVISEIDVASANVDSKISVYGTSQTVYASKNAFYLTSNEYSSSYISVLESQSNTIIYKITLDGELKLAATGKVPGVVQMEIPQFAFDEYSGNLRIATTVTSYTHVGDYFNSTTYSRVYVLDENLEILGTSDKLGINERLKSARYMVDVAYIVTFRNTDPLYALDLSDPADIKTLSELKIEGFSQYMQNYGDGYMLGIGYDADANSGGLRGLKLTMFDIRDKKNITAVNSIIYSWYGDTVGYASTEALYNHKALFIDAKKGIIGIPVTESVWEHDYEHSYTVSKFVFYSFDGNEFKEKTEVIIRDGRTGGNYYDPTSARGLYIGEYIYIVSDGGIISISLSDYTVCGTLKFE